MEEQHRQAMAQQQEEEEEEVHQDPNQYQHGEPGGALVQEARKLMQQDEEDEAPKADENAGPKIKMNRIGRKAKKGGADEKASKPGPSGAKEAPSMKPFGDKVPSGGFSEQDIEFMKKAIQVLCQSTNPLGKSIDFVTDDIDSMNKEFEHWKKESSSCQQQLQEQ